MADNEKEVETTPQANDWEVVSLTASTYDAFPGLRQVELNDNDKRNTVKEDEAETSEAMLMSDHFACSSAEPEKLQLEPQNIEISNIYESENIVSNMHASEGFKVEKKDDKNWNEIQCFNEKDNGMSFDEVLLKEEATFQGQNLIEKELGLCTGTPTMHGEEIGGLKQRSPFQGLNLIEKELSLCKSRSTAHDEKVPSHGQVEPAEGMFDSGESLFSVSTKGDDNIVPGQGCETWWKKHAASLYAQAKEASAFWSIFVAATMMGLAILGQHWQIESWQVLQLRWQFKVNYEKMGWVLSPLARFKDAIVGGNRRGFLIRSSSSFDK